MNPTKEQLNKLKGIIYAIVNKVNGKVYIGQTTRSFYNRYGDSYRWWNSTSNDYLKKSASKHGLILTKEIFINLLKENIKLFTVILYLK